MKWKFWKKNEDDNDTTTIQVSTSTGGTGRAIYIHAQTSDKALDLYKKLKEEKE